MITNNSYNTLRHGRVTSFTGYSITGKVGNRVLQVGYGPTGGPDYIRSTGRIVTCNECDGAEEFLRRVARVRWQNGEISYAEYKLGTEG
jgi:hypothetical protein